MPTIDTSTITPELLSTLSATTVRQIYNSLDCCITFEVLEKLQGLCNKSPIIYDFERALQAPVLEMMMRGFKVDQYERQKGIAALRSEMEELDKWLQKMAYAVWDKPLNPRSPQQLISFFYHKMRLPEQFKYEKGKKRLSTDREALEKLEIYFYARPIVSTILEIRNLGKQLSVLETEIDSDGRMRTSYNIAGTETGRWSSSSNAFGTGTNLQNITPHLRNIFVADSGYKLCGIDLEQAESREVGWQCGVLFNDWTYLDACYGGDLHTLTCRLIWPDLPWTGNAAQDRRIADEPFYRTFSRRDMSKRGGHGCLTEDHEVLTMQGWKSIALVSNDEAILAWNFQTGIANWEIPSAWTRKEWTGDLYEYEGKSISLCVTSDHRMPWISKRGKKNILPAEQLPLDCKTAMPITCEYHGGDIFVNETNARLHAAYQADGYLDKYGNVTFEFQKARKIERMEFLLNGTLYTKRVSPRGTTIFYIPRANFVFGGKFAGQYLLDWKLPSLQAFISELEFWDGCVFAGKTTISSKNREHLWWLFFIARISKQGALFNPCNNFDVGHISLNNRHDESQISLKRKKIFNHITMVYCPTVASGGFIVRRNGKVALSMNSNYLGTPFTMARHLKVPTKLMENFQHNYFKGFPAIPRWHRHIAQQLQQTQKLITPFGRQRHFFGRPNDDSTLREAVAYIPQSSTGDRLNLGLYRVWKEMRDKVQLIAQVHDALYFQYPEHEDEEAIISQALDLIDIRLRHNGRELIVPGEAKVGWNWASYDAVGNPNGLKKFKKGVKDERSRQSTSTI